MCRLWNISRNRDNSSGEMALFMVEKFGMAVQIRARIIFEAKGLLIFYNFQTE